MSETVTPEYIRARWSERSDVYDHVTTHGDDVYRDLHWLIDTLEAVQAERDEALEALGAMRLDDSGSGRVANTPEFDTLRQHIRTLEAQRDEAYHWLKIARHFAALHMSTNPNAAELVDYIAEVTDE